ncbi:MAG: NADH-quinone oxidoreductase subunit M [Puniceicoccales bacterium]|jgi:NADH-quinone oxidoreductase subunit M|nr:NADH-quinone oxidoreductase subunit M [Puniceicoccales bacterium]
MDSFVFSLATTGIGAGRAAGLVPLLIWALPLLGALVLALCPRTPNHVARAIGLGFSFSTLVLALGVLAQNAVPLSSFAFYAKVAHPLGVGLDLRLMPEALLLVLLLGVVAPLSLLASWTVERAHLFNTLFLLVQSAALGVFLSCNLVFWFLCWELSLFPAFFLIKLWGGPGAGRAAYQFVVYTIGGSAFMLLALAIIYAATGTLHWDLLALKGVALTSEIAGKFGAGAPSLVFLGILLGLAVKVPMFPFHTWLPATYAEAPPGVSMFLTAIMSKMGLWGVSFLLLRLFPTEFSVAAPYLLWLALAGIVLGAYAAIRQSDMKRMLAYSSVNHLGYCLLGFFAVARVADPVEIGVAASRDCALAGVWLQMFNHGLSAAALFFCAGVLESRSGVRGLGDFGGVRRTAPVFATLCGVALFSSLGLPGLNGFAGEFMIFRGVFSLEPWVAAVATLGLLGTAVFLLTFWQRVFHGEFGVHTTSVSDLTRREILVLVPVAALMLLLGIWPQLLLNLLSY